MAERDDHSIVLFDGVCNLCNGCVTFIIRHDRKDYFRFAALQSDKGIEIQERYGLNHTSLDALVVVEDGRAYLKSGAALRVARRLGLPYGLLSGFLMVPPFVRDFLYDWFASNRYGWFGKRDECMVPSPEVRERFVTD